MVVVQASASNSLAVHQYAAVLMSMSCLAQVLLGKHAHVQEADRFHRLVSVQLQQTFRVLSAGSRVPITVAFQHRLCVTWTMIVVT
jgi:hypothetical protein